MHFLAPVTFKGLVKHTNVLTCLGLRKQPFCTQTLEETWGLYLESPENFSGPKTSCHLLYSSCFETLIF